MDNNTVFKKVNEHSVRFNLRNFLNIQEKIWTKYDKEENVVIMNNTEKNFINNLDKYLLHTTEEVMEAYEESLKTEFEEDKFIEEVIDVLMYTGTMVSILERSVITKEIYVPNIFEDVVYEDDIQTCLMCIMKNMIDLRRLFPARKWHKPYTEKSEIENRERIIKSIEFLKHNIKIVLSILFKYDEEKVNNIILNKQLFILKL